MNVQKNYDNYYMDTPRHWSAESEAYTGADSLLTALEYGWQIIGAVYREDILYRGARMSAIYHVTLERQQERVVMSIVSNPFLVRYLKQRGLLVEQVRRALRRVVPHQEEAKLA